MLGFGWGELLVLGVLGFFLFGPDRLPGLARDAAKVVAQLRAMAANVTDEIRTELGPEVADLGLRESLADLRQLGDLRHLSPGRLVARSLFDDPASPPTSPPGYPTPQRATLPVGALPPYDRDAT